MSKEKLCPCCGTRGDNSHDPFCALTAYIRDAARVDVSPGHVIHLSATDAPSIVATTTELSAAFAAWETDYRTKPDGFYTVEEIAALEVADVSESRAIALQAYLRQVKSTN